MKKLLKKIGHALFGLYYVTKSQSSFRLLLAYSAIVVLLGILLPITMTQWFMLSFTVVFVLIAEIINTATEHLCNTIHRKKNIYIRVIKDISAGAVLIALVWSAGIAIAIFAPVIIALL